MPTATLLPDAPLPAQLQADAAPRTGVGRIIVSTAPANARPDFVRKESTAGADARQTVRDFVDGTPSVHARGEKYLPSWPGEPVKTYNARKTYAEVYNATGRALVAAEGMVFATPPKLDADANAKLVEHLKDVDGAGADLATYLRRVFNAGVQNGFAGILVDMPPRSAAPAGGLDRRQERELNFRPRWIRYDADQIINWRATVVRNRAVFGLLVLEETSVESDGSEFGCADVRRFRVFRLVRTSADALDVAIEGGVETLGDVAVQWSTWRAEPDPTNANAPRFRCEALGYVVDAAGKSFGEIPFAPYYATSPAAPLVAGSPIRALAETNLGYYRTASDRRWLLTLASAPLLVTIGQKPKPDGTFDEIPLGAGAHVRMPPGGDAKFIAAPSDALASSEKELDRLTVEMATLSLAFLAREGGAGETATGRRIESQAGRASLALSAHGLKDCADRAIGFHARFVGVEPTTVAVTTEYDVDKLDAPTMAALNQIRKDRGLSLSTFLRVMQEGGVIPEDVDLAEEESAIATEVQADADRATQAIADATLAVAENTPSEPAASDDPAAEDA